jgi:hypothetical protein
MASEKVPTSKKSAKKKIVIPPLETLNKVTATVFEPAKEPIPTGGIPEYKKVEVAKEMSEAMDKIIESGAILTVNADSIPKVSKEEALDLLQKMENKNVIVGEGFKQEWVTSKEYAGFTVAGKAETLEKVIASLKHQFNNGVMKGQLQEDIALLESL